MTSPLSPEAVAQMVADREAGTPGPWDVRTLENFGWNIVQYIMGDRHDIYRVAKVGYSEIDARRIACLPDLEAAYITLAAENATLRAERDAWTKIDVARDVDFATMRASEAAALERITELEALLAASTHSLPLPG